MASGPCQRPCHCARLLIVSQGILQGHWKILRSPHRPSTSQANAFWLVAVVRVPLLSPVDGGDPLAERSNNCCLEHGHLLRVAVHGLHDHERLHWAASVHGALRWGASAGACCLGRQKHGLEALDGGRLSVMAPSCVRPALRLLPAVGKPPPLATSPSLEGSTRRIRKPSLTVTASWLGAPAAHSAAAGAATCVRPALRLLPALGEHPPLAASCSLEGSTRRTGKTSLAATAGWLGAPAAAAEAATCLRHAFRLLRAAAGHPPPLLSPSLRTRTWRVCRASLSMSPSWMRALAERKTAARAAACSRSALRLLRAPLAASLSRKTGPLWRTGGSAAKARCNVHRRRPQICPPVGEGALVGLQRAT
mmetsp:Transcript_54114/g.168045  ORF Transcript_54114/g.168045 Transcript_54114/m.168045 type:complete len:364 (+) Transcript_54114:75-1166(+)